MSIRDRITDFVFGTPGEFVLLEPERLEGLLATRKPQEMRTLNIDDCRAGRGVTVAIYDISQGLPRFTVAPDSKYTITSRGNVIVQEGDSNVSGPREPQKVYFSKRLGCVQSMLFYKAQAFEYWGTIVREDAFPEELRV